MRIRYTGFAVLLVAVAGCGGQHRQASNAVLISEHISRPAAPIWCPINSPGNRRFQRNRLDTRTLLGRLQNQAAATAAEHGCRSRVVNIDGHGPIVTSEGDSRRVDLTIRHGIVTAVSIG